VGPAAAAAPKADIGKHCVSRAADLWIKDHRTEINAELVELGATAIRRSVQWIEGWGILGLKGLLG